MSATPPLLRTIARVPPRRPRRDATRWRSVGSHRFSRASFGRRPVLFEFRRLAIEQRIAKADVGLACVALLGEFAQRLERGDRRQHRDRVLAREPGDLAIIREGVWQRGLRRLGDQHLERQLRQRSGRNDQQCLSLIRSSI